MSKVITFSRTFPAYHPKAGQPTYFVEKFYNSLYSRNNLMDYPKGLEVNDSISEIKHHTIRAGSRFKVGDKFSPRVWGNDINPKNGKSGPYQSKQIIIAPDIEVKKVWEFEVLDGQSMFIGGADGRQIYDYSRLSEDQPQETKTYFSICENDGLSADDFDEWFGYGYHKKTEKTFIGQIICWNENITY